MTTTRKFLLLLLLTLGINSLIKAQTTYTEIYPNKRIIIDNENLNINLYKDKYDSRGILDYNTIKEDGTKVRVSCHRKGTNIEVMETLSYPYIHTLYKEFYPNGKLKQKGILMPKQVKVGNWLESTKNGEIRIINYDKDRSHFGYNDILEFLDQRDYLQAQPNGEDWIYSFWYSPETHQWGVRLSKEYVLYKRFTFDGKEGTLTKEETFNIDQ
ncbi:hypothetical protein JGH11_17230 [Dysgonomonas sp. Marseille-P4677]|uniref:hypothetical protein n=1 Tax=Dysgonomonas sp. Marseille-P4677 TaxID=2364790 RepID=UPI0019113C79|nr:hypothetical protein [Dysgonomonas sp. Marseille-P4677]MBK5722620.1 hypothetical protein [Dysgonomonas sp. Marseille-P4677]